MKLINTLNRYTNKISSVINNEMVIIISRIGLFGVFWLSAQSKIDGATLWGQKFNFWEPTYTTFMLFEIEYGLPYPEYMAYLATFAEFFLSLTILLGVFTRFSALALLFMTLVIQFVLPAGWPTHAIWAVCLLFLIKHGGGKFSVDKLIR